MARNQHNMEFKWRYKLTKYLKPFSVIVLVALLLLIGIFVKKEGYFSAISSKPCNKIVGDYILKQTEYETEYKQYAKAGNIKSCLKELTTIDGKTVAQVWYAFHDNMDFEDPFYCASQEGVYPKSCSRFAVVDGNGKVAELYNEASSATLPVLSKYGCSGKSSKLLMYKDSYWQGEEYKNETFNEVYGTCTLSGKTVGNVKELLENITATYTFNTKPCEDKNVGATAAVDVSNCWKTYVVAKSNPLLCNDLIKAPFSKEFFVGSSDPVGSCILNYAMTKQDVKACDLLPDLTGLDYQQRLGREGSDSCKTNVTSQTNYGYRLIVKAADL